MTHNTMRSSYKYIQNYFIAYLLRYIFHTRMKSYYTLYLYISERFNHAKTVMYSKMCPFLSSPCTSSSCQWVCQSLERRPVPVNKNCKSYYHCMNKSYRHCPSCLVSISPNESGQVKNKLWVMRAIELQKT